MIFRIVGLKRDRERIVRRIAGRRQRAHGFRMDLQNHACEWMATSRAKVQAFLAGFLVDQARPLLPAQVSPLKLGLTTLFRRMEQLVEEAP